MGFPSQVNVQPAIGVEGDFASTNPRASVMNQAGAFIAGTSGVTVGRFAWADAANLTVNSGGPLLPTGFVAREQQAYITQFLADSTMVIPQGRPVTLFKEGDFLVKNNGSGAAAIGNKAYANFSDGSVSFAASGSPPSAATIIGANNTIVANTFAATLAANALTASIAGQVMTVSAIGAGTVLAPGQTVAGTGVDPATTIVNQLTGTAGSTGTYTVSVSQTVASEAMTASGGGMTITGRTSGALLVGQVVTGTGIPAGTTITASNLATPISTSGTLALSAAPTAGSGVTITGAGAYLTVSTAITGAIKLNDTIIDTTTAGNMPANTDVSAFISGTGGLGTYMLSAAGATAASTDALSVPSAIETKWFAETAAAVGELVKMSSYALG